MAGAIRNACVARGTLAANTNSVVYTVPASNAFILKNVQVELAGLAAGTWSMTFRAATPATDVVVAVQTVAANQPGGFTGWAVLNAGDALVIGLGAIGATYWVSGAVLPFNPTQ